ncbi:PepSY domain-containing protein [Chelatococcus sp. GCM10030263]|uniref:PepSY domain-containing protein n=1 Tax=Chelatococcus sp. GCM10030263 TaxID=3273387 RepID=UPI00360E2415
MNKAILLKLHRWLALTFAIPLLVIIVTGLILSFEPIVSQSAIEPGSVTVQAVEGLLQRYDPEGTARALFHRPREHIIAISRGRPGVSTEIDLATGESAVHDATTLTDVFGIARRTHEHMVFRARWLVTASTIAMLALTGLGVFIGWPKLRNTLQGWHRGLGWFLLPLVVLSPLTGLLIALGVTFTPAPSAARSANPPLPLIEAVRILGAEHDLSSLAWIRSLGKTVIARVMEDGEMKTYALTRDGAVPTARNWPRLIHEGTWGGVALSILNLVTSVALLGLLVTGAWIWARRKLRQTIKRRRLPSRAV